jgi:putative solute:sodium symporter small subunit
MSEPTKPPEDVIDVHDPRIAASIQRYWRKNVRVMAACLVVWAIAGLGCGVLFADTLNRFSFGGFPLGFWFAQQGSIMIFVLLILVYGLALNRLDAEHHRELEEIRAARQATPEPSGK